MTKVYRITWFFFMLLVAAPALMVCGYMDGASFAETMSIATELMMHTMFMPQVLASILSPIVSAFAFVLPEAAHAIMVPGDFIWAHVGVFLGALYLVTIDPPFISRAAA